MKNLLIYGTNLQAESMFRMITMEGQACIQAFVVDHEYRKSDMFCGLPVIDFEKVTDKFNPDEYEICLSFGYRNMVRNRQSKYRICKEKGYGIFTFISKNAAVYTDDVGEGSIVYPGTVLAPCVRVGRGTFIECGCVIAHHSRIGDFNFIAPGVHFCGDVTTGTNCFIGGAAEITNGVTLGNYAFVAAFAKVSKDLKAKGVVLPGRSIRSEKTSFEMMDYM